jgi:hypothetical protein
MHMLEANTKGKQIWEEIKSEISTGSWVRPAVNCYIDGNRINAIIKLETCFRYFSIRGSHSLFTFEEGTC